jgi:alkylated DNA repair dioxygenase AlkB
VARGATKKSADVDGTKDLFGEPELPPGFRYTPDVISAAEERDLVARFEKLDLKPFEFHGYKGNRRIYTFGHRYAFAGQEARDDARIPDYLKPLMEIAGDISGTPAAGFEQIMVTEYAPGAGIGWHRDRPTYEDIVAISFLAPCALRLRKRDGTTGSACPRMSSRGQRICCTTKFAMSGNTASPRWMSSDIR